MISLISTGYIPTKCACARPTKVGVVKNFARALSLAIPLAKFLDQCLCHLCSDSDLDIMPTKLCTFESLYILSLRGERSPPSHWVSNRPQKAVLINCSHVHQGLCKSEGTQASNTRANSHLGGSGKFGISNLRECFWGLLAAVLWLFLLCKAYWKVYSFKKWGGSGPLCSPPSFLRLSFSDIYKIFFYLILYMYTW